MRGVLYPTRSRATTPEEVQVRIGMFADMYKPYLSGVTNYISLYKRRFEELGHEVWVFTFGQTDYEDDEPNVVRSPAIPWGDTGWQAGLALASEVTRVIPTLDIAHVHHPFVSGRVALRHCRPARIPVVFTSHSRYDVYSDIYAGFVPKALRHRFVRDYLNRFTRDVDLTIAPSRGIVEWLAAFGVTDESVLLENCVDTHPFRDPANPRSREAFGFPGDSVVFCYLGRIGAEKNLGLLTNAFVKVARDVRETHLLVLGDGPLMAQTRTELSEAGLDDRVHFAGPIPYDEVPGCLAAADVFVTASVSETYPLVVMEAAAAGLPAIGVRSTGIEDIIDDGVTGYLVPEDADAFAARMSELARDAVTRSRMSQAARAGADRFDVRVKADEMLGHYRRLMDARAP